MKVTINFENDEIEPALQRHLESGKSVQGYIRAAVKYFNQMLQHEEAGNVCGFGSKQNGFSRYNSVLNPSSELIERD